MPTLSITQLQAKLERTKQRLASLQDNAFSLKKGLWGNKDKGMILKLHVLLKK